VVCVYACVVCVCVRVFVCVHCSYCSVCVCVLCVWEVWCVMCGATRVYDVWCHTWCVVLTRLHATATLTLQVDVQRQLQERRVQHQQGLGKRRPMLLLHPPVFNNVCGMYVCVCFLCVHVCGVR
jgi:hypothetical protein